MSERPTLSLLGRGAAAVSLACLAYWGLFALVAPAMNLDSQMYDLARLELAWRGGLFDNGLFTSPYDIIWPWGFDAVHLPFLLAGFGYALPSFLCLVGICLVVRRMVTPKWGPDAAWVAILGLLGLTCLVYQATTTKNDIALTFAGAAWLYARARWKHSGAPIHTLGMAVAIGFMAGSKTTGLLFAAILSGWTLVECARVNRRLALRVLGLIAGAGLLLGSVETYVETYRTFGHLLGPPAIVSPLHTSARPAAIAKNLAQFVAGGVWDFPLPDALRPDALDRPRAAAWWHGLPIRSLQYEEFTGYGMMGIVALLTMGAALLCWRPRATWWRLAIAAVAAYVVVALTVRFNAWANRYILSTYALATLAAVIALWECPLPGRAALRWIVAGMAAVAALAAPLVSFNRAPRFLVESFTQRDRLEACAYPLGREVRLRLEQIEAKTPGQRIFYVVGGDSYVLPFLEDRALPLTMVTPPTFVRLLDAHVARPGDLVIEDLHVATERLVPIAEVSAANTYYPPRTMQTKIYRVKEPSS